MSSSSLRWSTATHSTVDVARIIASGDYDINPSHQRNVVHNLKWKRGIIDSCSGYAPADIPATYWQPHDTDDKVIYESVDGKQRITAIIEFIDNKFTWKNKFYDHKNKLSLTKKEKKRFDAFELIFKKANRTLTQRELSESFKKFQQTKTTKLGEILHATKGVLSTRIEVMMLKHSVFINDIIPERSQKRFQPLQVYARCFYLFCEKDKKYTPALVKNFWDKQMDEHYTLPSKRKFNAFGARMTEVFNLFAANKDIRSKSSKFISLFCLMCWSSPQEHHEERIDYLKENLTEIVKMDGFANINGNHDAAASRLQFLKDEVSSVFSDARSGEEDASDPGAAN
jgi:hypothetical protein